MNVYCKLKDCKIDTAECYDMQMAKKGHIIEATISERAPACGKNAECSDDVCSTCERNQISDEELKEILSLIRYIKNETSYPTQISKDGFSIRFHNDFVFEYTWNWETKINGKPFYSTPPEGIRVWIEQFLDDYYVIIQYSKKRLLADSLFKLVDSDNFKLKKSVSKSVEKIFTVNEVLYDNKYGEE